MVPGLLTRGGVPTSITSGFLNSLAAVIEKEQPHVGDTVGSCSPFWLAIVAS